MPQNLPTREFKDLELLIDGEKMHNVLVCYFIMFNDAVMKYMSELLQERKLRSCNVLKVMDEAN